MSIRFHQRPADEEGIALVTALLIMLLSTVVVAGILGLAIHTAQRSGLTRNKTAALNAAEAGIQAELSIISTGLCPTSPTSDTPLPNQSLPTASYIIQTPVACTPYGAATIAATGYVPNATNPVTSTTMVAHVNRSAGAPTSSGGYDFPDALFTDGALTSGTLSLYGTGGSIPSITADGPIAIGSSGNTGSLLGGGINGENTVKVYATQIGGAVAGTTVALTGPSSTSPLTVQGNVGASSSAPSLTNVTVNGTTSSGVALPAIARPLGTFNYSAGAIQTALGVATPATSCPANQTGWSANFYYLGSCSLAGGYAPASYNPAASNGITVIVVQGAFNVTIPPTAVGGQLYVVDAGSPSSDALTISGSGSTLPVFAYTDGSVNLSGNFVGQVAAHSITITGSQTTMTFSPPAIAFPNIAFNLGYSAPTSLTSGSNPYISTVASEYQCPGTTAC